MDSNLKRQILIDNVENPFHKGLENKDGYIKANTHNESCIDNVDLYVKMEDNIIKDAYFEGEACAITTSATSIMVKKIIGKTKEEARSLMKEYYKMIEEKEFDNLALGELNAYQDISKQPSRKKCAALPFQTLEKTLEISELEIKDN